MRTSTDQGKKTYIFLLTMAVVLACLSFLTLFLSVRQSSETKNNAIKSPISFSEQHQSLTSNYESSGSLAVKSNGQRLHRLPGRALKREPADWQFESEFEREMERERETEREPYDEPDEAARYLMSRRLPEGVKELPIELYLKAMEQALDLPQFSTVLNRILPSRREMAQRAAKDKNTQFINLETLQSWTSLGPGNVGGRTRALLINPKNPDIMYAGAASGGVWKTTDGGKSWNALTDLLPNLAVNALAFDPNNPDIIYAGTGEGYFNSDAMRGAGIFRSFDGGNTWRRLDGTGTPDFYFVNDIVVSPNNYNRIYAATNRGVMRSNDGGASWTPAFDESYNNGCSDLEIRTDQPTDVVFAACGIPKNVRAPGSVQALIYRNNNAGALGQWEVVYTEEGMSRTSLAIAPSNQNVIYAVSSENGASGTPHTLHAVFRSSNGGEAGSWIKVNDGRSGKLNSSLFTNALWAFQSECRQGGVNQIFAQGWYDNVIAVDPANENIVWVGGIDLFRSDDGGVNWGMASDWNAEKGSSRYVHADHHAIVFHPQFNGVTNRVMFVGTDGGVFRTLEARNQVAVGNKAPCSPIDSRIGWTSLNNGYAVTQFYHGAAFPGGNSYLGGAQDNGVILGSDTAGFNGWTELLSGDGGYVAIDPSSQDVIYAETNGLSLKKSEDGGKKWVSATNGINNSGFGFIVPLAMDPSDPNRLWLAGRTLWRTKNGAISWTPASAPLRGTTATAITVAQTDGNFVLAGTDQGYIHRTTIGLNSSADTVWPEAQPRSGVVSSLAFDPTNRDIAYATYSTFSGKHVWRSLNGGASWQQIDGTGTGMLPDIPVNCIVVDPTNTQRLYIGTDIGVFTSPDGGTTWAVENSGFANAPVESLSISLYKGAAHLFAFTRGRGAWRVPLGQVCTYSISPPSQTFDAMGGTAAIRVATTADCSWTVENSVGWITITGETNRSGNGEVNISVAQNSEPKPRSGTFNIAGKSFTVTQAGLAVSVSAASLTPGRLAPESIVAAFGAGMADATQIARGSQLPTNLEGTELKVRDKNGIERPSPLFFVSPNQINYQLPQGTEVGPASVTIYNGNDKVFNCVIQVARVAPGFFTANGNGTGVAVGQALHYRQGRLVQSETLSMLDAGQNRVVARPIDLGPDMGANSDQVFLVLYGTGFRFRSSLETVTATLGGINAQVSYVGEQGQYPGLDQVNILIPRELAGRGEVDLVLIVDGQQANVVKISIK